jgi:hypothetical protein
MNYHLIRYRNNWNDYWSAVHSLNRKAELIRLVQWAKRKRLTGPLKLYLTRLRQEENSIMHLRARNPKILAGARLMHCISNFVSPTPRYYPKGSAKHYRQYKTKRYRNH